MSIEVLNTLFIVLNFQLIFISVFLFLSKKGKPFSNKILATVFLMLFINVFSIYAMLFGMSLNFPRLMFIDDTFLLAYGPLIYLFTQSVLFKKFKFRKQHFTHFIPFLLILITVLYGVVFVDLSCFIEVNSHMKNLNIPYFAHIIEFTVFMYLIFYLIKSKILIKKVLSHAYEKISTIDDKNIIWLKFIIHSFLILFSIAMIHSILPIAGIKNGLIISIVILVVSLFYFINYVLFKMLNHSTNDSGIFTETSHDFKDKYGGSSLSAEQLRQFKNDLSHFMDKSKIYLNDELSIDTLAQEINIPSKTLSQVINQGFSCNFFDFINQYRIEYVKSLLKSPNNKKTILEIMYESGFNSKSSFNTAFKKFTNTTPSAYKKSTTS